MTFWQRSVAGLTPVDRRAERPTVLLWAIEALSSEAAARIAVQG